MKSTINKLVYDTDKATLVAVAGNQLGNGFHVWTEKLYLTREGNWFLHCWGCFVAGDLTDYTDDYFASEPTGDRITPMSAEEALAWCEKHQQQEPIDQYFKDMIEVA